MQFRRDYWVKGARRLSALEQAEALRAQKVVLVAHRPDVSLKVTGALGEANLTEAIYSPVLDALAEHKPRSPGQLNQGKKQPTDWAQQAWQVLAGQGQKLVKEGKALESSEENLAELTSQAQAFAEKQLPILEALQVV